MTPSLNLTNTGNPPVFTTIQSLNSRSHFPAPYSAVNENSNFFINRAKTIRISARASARPAQYAGPSENGKKARVSCAVTTAGVGDGVAGAISIGKLCTIVEGE